MNRKEEMEALADQIKAYFDDGPPNDGSHSDAAGANAFELLRSAEFALRASAAPEEGNPAVPPVERIEMVDYASGYRMEAEPEWRVQVSGVCADFQTETAANNFRNAILALPSDSGKAEPVACARCGSQDGVHSVCKNCYPLLVAALAPATEGGGREGMASVPLIAPTSCYCCNGPLHLNGLRYACGKQSSEEFHIDDLSPSPSVGTGTVSSARREAEA